MGSFFCIVGGCTQQQILATLRFNFCVALFETRSHYEALTALEFTMKAKLASKSQRFTCLLNDGIQGMVTTPGKFFILLIMHMRLCVYDGENVHVLYIQRPEVNLVSQFSLFLQRFWGSNSGYQTYSANAFPH